MPRAPEPFPSGTPAAMSPAAGPGAGPAAAGSQRAESNVRSLAAPASPALPELGGLVVRASALVRRAAPLAGGEPWPPPGHVLELTGDFAGAATSTAVQALADVQRAGGIAAWLQPQHGALFPPDLDANGVDLDALVVVHLPV